MIAPFDLEAGVKGQMFALQKKLQFRIAISGLDIPNTED